MSKHLKAMWWCEECGKPFPSRGAVERHQHREGCGITYLESYPEPHPDHLSVMLW